MKHACSQLDGLEDHCKSKLGQALAAKAESRRRGTTLRSASSPRTWISFSTKCKLSIHRHETPPTIFSSVGSVLLFSVLGKSQQLDL